MVLDRRGFMKFLAGASLGATASPIPWKLLDDVSIWTQNWSWRPKNIKGETTYAHTVSKTSPANEAIRVRLVGGRPVRVLPDEDHPLGGGITALSAAEVQMLYSPGRVQRPLRRSADGAFAEISWEEAFALLRGKFAEAGADAAFVCGDETSSLVEVFSAVARALGSENVFLMPSEGQSAARACKLMGIEAQVGYDVAGSDHVLAIGANVLESWGPVVRTRKLFAAATPHPAEGQAPSMTLAYAGPVQNNTASVARPWLPILPGTETALALGLAAELINRGRRVNAVDFDSFAAMVRSRFSLAETSKITGLSEDTLRAVADALLAARAPLVIVGGEFNQGAGAAPVMAGIALNALLGNFNRKGGLTFFADAPTAIPSARGRAELFQNDLPGFIAAGAAPKLLVLHEANPVYALPDPEAVAAFVKGAGFSVSFSSFMDETSSLCSLVLPIGVGLERLDDVVSPYGCDRSIYCIAPAVVEPRVKVCSTADVLLQTAAAAGRPVAGVTSFAELLKQKARAMQGNYDLLAKGKPVLGGELLQPYYFMLRADVLGQTPAQPSDGPLFLAALSKMNMGTAKTGIPPFNTKTIRSDELVGSDMFVMMNGATAAKKGLRENDRVRVLAQGRSIPARLRIFEGVTPDTVAVCLGFGHTALDEFSQNKGANVMVLFSAAPEPGTGLYAWAGTGVDVTKAQA